MLINEKRISEDMCRQINYFINSNFAFYYFLTKILNTYLNLFLYDIVFKNN